MKNVFISIALLCIALMGSAQNRSGGTAMQQMLMQQAATQKTEPVQDETTNISDAEQYVNSATQTVISPASDMFEGEIYYETYENYSDYILKMPNSIYFNGVHKVRLIIKGGWMHMIDETTGCHIIVNDAAAKSIMAKLDTKEKFSFATLSESRSNNSYSYVHFCDHTKTGLDLSDAPGTQYILGPYSISYADGQKAPISSYSFAKTEEAKEVLGQNCPLYAGKIVRSMGGMEQTYDVKAWVSEDLAASEGYKWNLYGLDIPGIALKWVMKYDGGHISFANVGELSYYIEADVVKITPRQVADEEFNIPGGYSIKPGGSSDAFKMMAYYKSVKKELEKRGIKGGENNQKTTGVHYKTDGEWDF